MQAAWKSAVPFLGTQITSSALIFTATVTPYEIALLDSPETVFDGLFLTNRAIDCIFLADCLSLSGLHLWMESVCGLR